MEYIELSRTFRDEPQDTGFEDGVQPPLSGRNKFGRDLDWTQPLNFDRVVLLAEAGSGKTKEMQEQVRILNQQGRFAFFLPLEALDREPVGAILSPDSEKRFEKWRTNSEQTAWFFLDAVDELKLVSGKLDRALNRLRKDLDGFLDRTRVIVSSRPSDWRFISDRQAFEKQLPITQRVGYVLSQPPEETFIAPLSGLWYGTRYSRGVKELNDQHRVRIVTMLPLIDRQVELFVEHSGLREGDAFLNEMERQNAWTFARRPLDLSELITAWRRSGHLGTRTQQHEENVTARLMDDSARSDGGASRIPRLAPAQNALHSN